MILEMLLAAGHMALALLLLCLLWLLVARHCPPEKGMTPDKELSKQAKAREQGLASNRQVDC
jgi:hypothetical protein